MSDEIPRPGHYWPDRASEHNREIERLRAELDHAIELSRVSLDQRDERIAECRRLRAELAECRAAAPPTPAAVVRVGVWGGSLTTRLVLFADAAAASEFYVKSDHVYDIFISPDTEIVWHPAGTPSTTGEPKP